MLHFYKISFGGLFWPLAPVVVQRPQIPPFHNPRSPRDTTWSFLNFFDHHRSAIVKGRLTYMHRKVDCGIYEMVSSMFGPKSRKLTPQPLSESWGPAGPLVDDSIGQHRDRFPRPSRRSQPQPTYKGQRSPERGIVACTTLTKMNSFVSPSIPHLSSKSKDDCFFIPA